jgi:hypothetical protein
MLSALTLELKNASIMPVIEKVYEPVIKDSIF